MRRYGAFEVARDIGALYENEVPEEELEDIGEDAYGRVYTRARRRRRSTSPRPARRSPTPTAAVRSGSGSTARCSAAFRPRRASSSSTPRPSPPGVGRSTRPRPTSRATSTRRTWPRTRRCSISTFRIPTQIHTRSAQRQVARRDLPHQPPVASPVGRRVPGGRNRRPGAGLDRDRPLRGQGLGRPRASVRHRRLQPPHGPLEAPRPGPAPADGDRRPRPRRRRVGRLKRRRRSAPSSRRPRYEAHLVDRRRGAPEPDLPGPPRPDLGDALLAPGGAGQTRRARRPLRRDRGRHRPGRTRCSATGWPRPGRRRPTRRTATAVRCG